MGKQNERMTRNEKGSKKRQNNITSLNDLSSLPAKEKQLLLEFSLLFVLTLKFP